MNSTELKRALLADPTHLDPEQIRALEQDVDLRRYFNDALELDGWIHQAMEVPVPDDLEERLQTLNCGQAANEVPKARLSWLKGGALAASLALAVVGYQWFGHGSLPEEIIAHIQHEPASLMSDNPVDMRDLKALLADYDIRLKAPLGKVTYLTRCRVQGRSGIHMVLDTPQGRVTVFLVPDMQLDEMTEIHGDGLEGYALGLQNRFAMAIIGQTGQPLMQVERLVRDALAMQRKA